MLNKDNRISHNMHIPIWDFFLLITQKGHTPIGFYNNKILYAVNKLGQTSCNGTIIHLWVYPADNLCYFFVNTLIMFADDTSRSYDGFNSWCPVSYTYSSFDVLICIIVVYNKHVLYHFLCIICYNTITVKLHLNVKIRFTFLIVRMEFPFVTILLTSHILYALFKKKLCYHTPLLWLCLQIFNLKYTYSQTWRDL